MGTDRSTVAPPDALIDRLTTSSDPLPRQAAVRVIEAMPEYLTWVQWCNFRNRYHNAAMCGGCGKHLETAYRDLAVAVERRRNLEKRGATS